MSMTERDAHAQQVVTTDAVAAYQRDGAVCVRGLLSDGEVALLREGIDSNLAAPSPRAIVASRADDPGRFVEDFCNWQYNSAYRRVIFESPLAATAARLMRCQSARLYHDHMLTKEPGTRQATPWHQGQPYQGVLAFRSPRVRPQTAPNLGAKRSWVWGPSEALQRRVGAVWGLTRKAGVPKGAGPRCASCLGPNPRRRAAPCPAPLATPARGVLNANTPCNIDGHDNVSMWIAVDPVRRHSTLEFVAGSHRGPWLMPRTFMDQQAKWFPEGSLADLPDVEAKRNELPIIGWEIEPGDVVCFHMLALHAAGAVDADRRRRVFSVRFLGDDIRHAPRRWKTSPEFAGLADALPAGAPMDHPLFPIAWPRPT